jgi:hypothetical protein
METPLRAAHRLMFQIAPDASEQTIAASAPTTERLAPLGIETSVKVA